MSRLGANIIELKHRYPLGHDAAAAQLFAGRDADLCAGFLRPHLKPGMSVLDCGCGPGAVSVALAKWIAPGQLIGVDLAEEHLELARQRAKQSAVHNARFQIGNAYALPFDDASFDVIYCNAVLEYLGRPQQVLRELRRVLKPGGLLAMRSVDLAGGIAWPNMALHEFRQSLIASVMQEAGGDANLGRKLPALMKECELQCIGTSATMETSRCSDDLQERVQALASLWRGDLGQRLVSTGILSKPMRNAVTEELTTWANRPGAFMATPFVEVLARKP
jgi:SAM-dependent methyltransferase